MLDEIEHSPCDNHIHYMKEDLLPVDHRPPSWSRTRSNPAVIPGSLIVAELFQNEIVYLNYVGVLFKDPT
jgi:hypothetical protein